VWPLDVASLASILPPPEGLMSIPIMVRWKARFTAGLVKDTLPKPGTTCPMFLSFGYGYV
jgi:hypothetical protein